MAKRDVGRSYWLPAAVPLTSTANEVQFGNTLEAKADIDIAGGVTNLAVSTFKLRDVSGKQAPANEYAPLYTLFGKRDSARHPYYWPRALRLNFGNRLEAEVKNAAAGAEAAGHLVFLGIPVESPQSSIEGLETQGVTRVFSINSQFTGSAADLFSVTSPEQDGDFIVHGAYTDLASAQLRITGVHGEQFMNDWTPIWALACRSTSQLPVLHWPRPYLIPRGSTITVDFKNPAAEASGKLYLVGQKL